MTMKEMNEIINRGHEVAQNASKWDELKQTGSSHYRTAGGIQPIDLYKSMGILRSFAIASIIKYAVRNAGTGKPEDDPISTKDMKKIIHYSELLISAYGGK